MPKATLKTLGIISRQNTL